MKKTYISPRCRAIALESTDIIASSPSSSSPNNIRANMNYDHSDSWGNSNERRSEIWDE